MEHREVAKLKPNPNNPRGVVVVDDALRELADSIKEHGVLQPIVITPAGLIVAGHRRFEAAKMAGLRDIPVVVRELNETQQIQIMLVENLQRQDLNPVQEGQAYLKLTERGLSLNQISKVIGIGQGVVTLRVAVANLPPEIHFAFAEGHLPAGCVACLVDLPPTMQVAWVIKAVARGWTGAKLSSRVSRYHHQAPTRKEERQRAKDEMLERIWARVEDGCYTPETIVECSECGHRLFNTLTAEDVRRYLDLLVEDGRAEWRSTEGARKESQSGAIPDICVPKDLPHAGAFYEPRAESRYEQRA